MLMKLGKLPRVYNPNVPHMSALVGLRTEKIQYPESIDYAKDMKEDLGMMLNDQIGCCTCASYYHAMQVWSFHTNKTDGMITQPDNNVLQLYKESCGYDPDRPLTDQGGIMQNVLTYLLNTGAITGWNSETHHPIRSFVEVDTRNLEDVKHAIYDCGALYIGFSVPSYLLAGEPKKLWEYKKNCVITGGHAITLTGYDKKTFSLISWGKKYKMTHEFFSRFVDEAYAICDIDWFTETGKSILGLSIKELELQMKELRKKR